MADKNLFFNNTMETCRQKKVLDRQEVAMTHKLGRVERESLPSQGIKMEPSLSRPRKREKKEKKERKPCSHLTCRQLDRMHTSKNQ
jgi:hypothetical protein